MKDFKREDQLFARKITSFRCTGLRPQAAIKEMSSFVMVAEIKTSWNKNLGNRTTDALGRAVATRTAARNAWLANAGDLSRSGAQLHGITQIQTVGNARKLLTT